MLKSEIKMWRKIANLLKQSTDNQSDEKKTSSADVVKTAIDEMEKVLAQTQNTLRQATAQQQDIHKTLKKYQQEAQNLQQQAIQAVKKNDEKTAEWLLQRKKEIDNQLKYYTNLDDELLKAIRHSALQADKLRLKIEQTRSEQAVLTLRLQNAKTQKDLADFLYELDKEGIMPDYQMQIDELEAASGLRAALEEQDFEQELAAATKTSSVDLLKEQLLAEEKKAEEAKQKAYLEQIAKLFEQNMQPNTLQIKEIEKQQAEKRKAEMQAFFEQKNTDLPAATDEKSKNIDKKIEDFFADKKADKQKRIDDFFNS